MGSAAIPDTTFRSAPFAERRIVTTSHRLRIVIALGCAALVFMPELAEPVAGHAQTSSRDRGLSELWRTYPLEPRTEDARLRSESQFDQLKVPLPSSGEAPAERTTAPVAGPPSPIGDGSSAPSAPLVLILSLVGLIVIVLVVRPAATVGRHVPGSRARFGSAVVSPVLGAVLRSAMVGIYSKRGEILLYAFAVVASVAVGIGVALLLSDG
jgi:hypothetical protein